MENDKDTRGKESEETRPPGEVLGDQSNAVVTTVIKDKVVLLIQLSTAQPLTRHGENYEVTRDRRGGTMEQERNSYDGSDAKKV